LSSSWIFFSVIIIIKSENKENFFANLFLKDEKIVWPFDDSVVVASNQTSESFLEIFFLTKKEII